MLMHTYVCLLLTSMFTLVLHCYLCLITFVLVSMAAYLWYMTVLAMLLRRGGGHNNAEMYAVVVVTPHPPPLPCEITFQKGGCNNARVRYVCVCVCMHA